jgi:hypothetical protein
LSAADKNCTGKLAALQAIVELPMYVREPRVRLRHYLEQGLSKAEVARSAHAGGQSADALPLNQHRAVGARAGQRTGAVLGATGDGAHDRPILGSPGGDTSDHRLISSSINVLMCLSKQDYTRAGFHWVSTVCHAVRVNVVAACVTRP